MILNDDSEALERLNHPDNLINKLERRKLFENRTGPKQFGSMIQTLAVETAKLSSQEASASAFGMTQENISYLTNKGKNIDHEQIEKNIETVHSRALDTMLESIDLIKPKLKDVKK